MKRERLMGIAGTLIRSASVIGAGVCAAAALALSAHVPSHRLRAAFTLKASPRSMTVRAGRTVRYHIVVRRGRYRGPIRLRLGRIGPGLLSRPGNFVQFLAHGRRAVLIIQTASVDPPRRYRVRINAFGGHHRRHVTIALILTAPKPAPFTVSGNVGSLWPGTSRSLKLALTNPSAQPISIRSLYVAIKEVSAPRATDDLPCSLSDFSVRQFAGAYPLRVPPHTTVRLSQLGVPAAAGPQLVMLNRPVNQDGCQGATVLLSYSGTATSG